MNRTGRFMSILIVMLIVVSAGAVLYKYTRSYDVTYDGLGPIVNYQRYLDNPQNPNWKIGVHHAHPLQLPLLNALRDATSIKEVRRVKTMIGYRNVRSTPDTRHADPLLPYYNVQIIFGAAGLGLMFLWLLEIAGAFDAAALLTAMLAFSYGYWNFTVQLESYIVPLFFSECAMFAAWQYYRHGAPWLLPVSGALLAVTVSCHSAFAGVAPAALILVILRPTTTPRHRRWHALYLTLAAAMTWVALLAYVAVQIVGADRFWEWYFYHDVGRQYFSWLHPSFEAALFGPWKLARNFTWAIQPALGLRESLQQQLWDVRLILPLCGVLLLCSWTGLLVCRLVYRLRQDNAAMRGLILGMLVWAGLMFVIVVFYRPDAEDPKYFGPLLPPLIMLAGVGLYGERRLSFHAFAVATLLLTVYMGVTNFYCAFQPRMDPAHNPDRQAAMAMQDSLPHEHGWIITYNNTTAAWLELYTDEDTYAAVDWVMGTDQAAALSKSNAAVLLEARLREWPPEVRDYFADRHKTRADVQLALDALIHQINPQATLEKNGATIRIR